MRVTFVNKSDSKGGAAIVTLRLVEALRTKGIDARLLVAEKTTDKDYVALAANGFRLKYSFILERLKIFLHNGFKRSTLFQIDTASDGVDIQRHPWIKKADIVCLNWVNQGMLSLKGISRIQKPLIWTMHDMWNFTGVCHHAGDCNRYTAPITPEDSVERFCVGECGMCPILGHMKSDHDYSHSTWMRKKKLYGLKKIHFVAVSRWLLGLAKKSSLLYDLESSVIGNPFPITRDEIEEIAKIRDGIEENLPTPRPIRLLIGAARLDDPIKGLPYLIEATNIIAKKYPELANRMVLSTFGSLKKPDSFAESGIKRTDLGILSGQQALKEAYLNNDIVISSSLYETLPGTLVEGQAYGCVPVSFNRGGQSDIVEHGKTGILCQLTDDHLASAESLAEGIVRAACMMLNKKTRNLMSESVISKFSAEAIADKYISLFRSFL